MGISSAAEECGSALDAAGVEHEIVAAAIAYRDVAFHQRLIDPPTARSRIAIPGIEPPKAAVAARSRPACRTGLRDLLSRFHMLIVAIPHLLPSSGQPPSSGLPSACRDTRRPSQITRMPGRGRVVVGRQSHHLDPLRISSPIRSAPIGRLDPNSGCETCRIAIIACGD